MKTLTVIMLSLVCLNATAFAPDDTECTAARF